MPGTIQVTLTTPFEPDSARQAMAEDLVHRLQQAVVLPTGPLGNILGDDRIAKVCRDLQASSDEGLAHFGFSLKGLETGCSTVILDQSAKTPAWGMIIRRRINIFFDETSFPSVFSVDHEIVDGFGDYRIEPDILVAEAVLIEMIASCYADWCIRAHDRLGSIMVAPVQHHVLGNSFSEGEPLLMMAQAVGAALSNHETGIRQIGPFMCAAGFKGWQRPAKGASDAASLRLRALGASTTLPMEWNSRSTKFGATTPEVTGENEGVECKSLVHPDEFAEIALETEWQMGHPATRIPPASDNRFNINVRGLEETYLQAIYSVRHDIVFDTTGPLDLIRLNIAVDHEWGVVENESLAEFMAEDLALFILETCRNVINRPGSVKKRLELDVSVGAFLARYAYSAIGDVVEELRSYAQAMAPGWFDIQEARHIIDLSQIELPVAEMPLIFRPMDNPIRIERGLTEDVLDEVAAEFDEFEEILVVDLVDIGSRQERRVLVNLEDLEGSLTRWPFLLALGTTEEGRVESMVISTFTGKPVSIVPDARRIGPLPHIGDIGAAMLHGMRTARAGIVHKGPRKLKKTPGVDELERIICENFRVHDAAIVPYSMVFSAIPGTPPLVHLLIGNELTDDEWVNVAQTIDRDMEHLRDDRYPIIVVPDRLDCGFGEGDVLTALTTALSRMAVVHICEDDPGDVISVVRFVAQRLALKLGARYPGSTVPGPVFHETDVYFSGMKESLEAFADGEISMRMPTGRKMRLYEAAAMIAAIAQDINEDLSRQPHE